MISHHKSTTYYPQGNKQAKLINKTLGKILAKLVNANQTNWDVMLAVFLWAYWMAYEVTTQYTPCEMVYGIQPIMPTKFVVPIERVCDLPQEDLNKTIQVRMEDLFRLDEIFWQVGENTNHIQLMRKE